MNFFTQIQILTAFFLVGLNLSAAPTEITLEATLSKSGKNLTATVTGDSDMSACLVTIYGSHKLSKIETDLSRATILNERVATSEEITFNANKLKKPKKGRKSYLRARLVCGIIVLTSEVVTLKVKRSKKGPKNINKWLRTISKKLARSSSNEDEIMTDCSVNDQFDFEELGDILTSSNVGIDVGETIADSSSFLRSDGSVRKYFFANGRGLMTATATDGINFTVVSTPVLGEGMAAHNKVYRTVDGSLRLYTPISADGGIVSYTSSDELTFTKEDGIRVSAEEAGLDLVSHLSIVPTSDGRYRGYFSNLPRPGDQPSDRRILSAISSDLLNWTVESGERLGPDAGTLIDPAEQPHALFRGNNCVTLFYFKALSSDNKEIGLYYSTSTDGLNFTKEYSSDINGNGPDIIRLSNGNYILYYDNGTDETGFQISAASLEME